MIGAGELRVEKMKKKKKISTNIHGHMVTWSMSNSLMTTSISIRTHKATKSKLSKEDSTTEQKRKKK